MKQNIKFKKYKNIKAFTLIELLAVIVILAMLALIAVPIVTGLIENSRKKAALISAENVLKIGKIYHTSNRLSYNPETGLIRFDCKDNKCISTELDYYNPQELVMDGQVGDGYILGSKDGNFAFQLSMYGYCAYKYFGSDEIKVTRGDCSKIEFSNDATRPIIVEKENSPIASSNRIIISYDITENESKITDVTCRYGDKDFSFDKTSDEVNDSQCTIRDVEFGKTIYYEICATDEGKNVTKPCLTGKATTKPVSAPTIAWQGYNYVGTTNVIMDGYVYSDEATVNFDDIGVYNAKHYIKTSVNTKVNVEAIPCGTGVNPVCEDRASTLAILNANTWYQITGNKVVVTFDEQGNIEAYTYDETGNKGYSNGNSRKIDKTAPTNINSNISNITSNSVTVNAMCSDQESGIEKIEISKDGGKTYEAYKMIDSLWQMETSFGLTNLSLTKSNVYENGTKVYKYVFNNISDSKQSGIYYRSQNYPQKLTNGTEYVWSVYLKSNRDITVEFLGQEQYGYSRDSLKTNFERYDKLFTAKEHPNSAFVIYGPFIANDELYVHSLSLREKGVYSKEASFEYTFNDLTDSSYDIKVRCTNNLGQMSEGEATTTTKSAISFEHENITIINNGNKEEIDYALRSGLTVKDKDGQIINNATVSYDLDINNLENKEYNVIYTATYDDKVITRLRKVNVTNKTNITTFDTPGEGHAFTPTYNGVYKIELWGAQGGNDGGHGAYTSGNIELDSNDTLYVYVGGEGKTINWESGDMSSIDGGFNGGGIAVNQRTFSNRYWGSGGGATDIRLKSGLWDDFDSLKTRIMVAAGGGGSFNQSNIICQGGVGGTLTGFDGEHISGNTWGTEGLGGTQKSGGYSSCLANTSCPNIVGYYAFGGFGLGGQSFTTGHSGGGSGYYGGGGSFHVQSAGGGSSFISGYEGCDAIEEESTIDHIIHTGKSIHYSGYIFDNPNMIAGNSDMPNYDGNGTIVGNSGNGYAKITLIYYY